MKKHLAEWQAWGHHMAGTCKIGASNDKYAVLDSKLNVKGVNKLRVVDCSVYPAPYLHAYNPSCGVYAIAEMAADIIKDSHK
jgi:choline dehydrogenase